MEQPKNNNSENKASESQRRQKLLELQELDGKIKQIEDGLVRIEEQIIEINTIIESIKDLEKLNEGANILVPVSNGIFIEAKISDPNKLKVNVGANTIVEKTNSETCEMLQNQLTIIEGYKNEMFLELQNLVKYASTLQTDMLLGENE